MGITRQELFQRLGYRKVVDPILEEAYKHVETKAREKSTYRRSGFYPSEFPNPNSIVCARKAIYGLMGIPEFEEVKPYGRAIMDAGKDIERQIVRRLKDYGSLLSADPDEEKQTALFDLDTWINGYVDAIILPKGWTRPHVVEIKTKDQEVLDEMRKGYREPDDGHVAQLLLYIWLLNRTTTELWPDLQPCTSGSLYYVSRSKPRVTYERYYDLDESFVVHGRKLLSEWKESFLQETLPPRPKEWRWTEAPCKWCNFKKLCKQDYREKITDLKDSNVVYFAKTIDPKYDLTKQREYVINRWDRKHEESQWKQLSLC